MLTSAANREPPNAIKARYRIPQPPSKNDSKSEKVVSTVGTKDVAITPCAPGGGGMVVSELTVAANATSVRLDFTQTNGADQVFALGQAVEQQVLDQVVRREQRGQPARTKRHHRVPGQGQHRHGRAGVGRVEVAVRHAERFAQPDPAPGAHGGHGVPDQCQAPFVPVSWVTLPLGMPLTVAVMLTASSKSENRPELVTSAAFSGAGFTNYFFVVGGHSSGDCIVDDIQPSPGSRVAGNTRVEIVESAECGGPPP